MKKIITLKLKPISHQLQKLTEQESRGSGILKFGYTVLVWKKIYEVLKI